MIGSDNCEFIAYSCAGGLPSFEKGHCFPQIDASLSKNSTNFIKHRNDLGRLGEDVMGEGVLYFVTRAESPFCGKKYSHNSKTKYLKKNTFRDATSSICIYFTKNAPKSRSFTITSRIR